MLKLTVVEVPLFVTALVTFISLTAPSVEAATIERNGDASYGILLDAGSTSTKLKVYRWKRNSSPNSVPEVNLEMSERIKPGLSFFSGDDSGLQEYLGQILEKAREIVPAHQQGITPIYLMATAGMRYLNAEDAQRLMDKTRDFLHGCSANPFLFNKDTGVQILSGEEEGVYSWIAANYLLGFFDENRADSTSVGILEMGGGSTQIAFIPSVPIFSEEFQVTVAKQQYSLYVQSFLQFGANGIEVKVADVLSQEVPGKEQLESPCMLRGDSSELTMSDGRVLTVTGTGSPSECLIILADILDSATGDDCQPKPCSIGSVYQPVIPDGMHFYATSAFTYAPKELNVLGDDNVLNITKLREAAFPYCDRTLDEAIDSGASAKYASGNCLRGLYISTLLTSSYGFSETTTDITVTSEIGGEGVDWALGAMLLELSQTFSDREDFVTKPPPGFISKIKKAMGWVEK